MGLIKKLTPWGESANSQKSFPSITQPSAQHAIITLKFPAINMDQSIPRSTLNYRRKKNPSSQPSHGGTKFLSATVYSLKHPYTFTEPRDAQNQRGRESHAEAASTGAANLGEETENKFRMSPPGKAEKCPPPRKIPRSKPLQPANVTILGEKAKGSCRCD